MKPYFLYLLLFFLTSSFQAQELLLHIPQAHLSDIHALAFSEDGKTIFSAGSDEIIYGWDTETGQQTTVLKGHQDFILNLETTFNHLISAGRGEHIFVWNLQTHQLQHQLSTHEYHVEALDYCVESGILASGSRDNSVKLWHPLRQEEMVSLRGHGGDVKVVALSVDGTWLASADSEKVLRIWTVKSRGLVKKLQGNTSITALAFSNEGAFLAAAIGKNILVWDTKTWKIAHRLRGHTANITALETSPDGHFFTSTAKDGKVIFWNIETGRVNWSFVPHETAINTFVFEKNGRTFATAGEDRSVKIWMLEELNNH